MSEITTWQAAVAAGGREVGIDHLTALVAGALEEELPVLREDPDLLDAARASVAANISLAVQLAQGTIALGDLEPPPQGVAFARELARRNTPIAELDRAYRVAQRALWRWSADQVRARVAGDVAAAIEGLSEAVFATGDVFSGTVMKQYALERERWLRSADAIRAETLKEVLSGAPIDVGASSRRLGYELRQRHRPFVLWCDHEASVPEAVATRVAGPRALLAPAGVGVLSGWAPEGTLDPDALDETTRLGLGSAGTGADGFRRGHHEAMEARRAARLAGHHDRVTRYEDIALLALLTHDLDQARRFVDAQLGQLTGEDAASVRLADTLYAVLQEHGSPRRAAHRLGVHENTVAKRLRAVEDRLGAGYDADPASLLAALTVLRALRPTQA